ncbi:hypothetical protein BVRB_3g060340 [Beta vulgaris subsp. vulgaris]|nr:hypothetical protein BVRB_3g060340 [Beta vulgaris subsp. vulgaris]
MAEPPSSSPTQNTITTTTTTNTNNNTSTKSSWGTLEELLLACAVHRYGTNSWDSIAKELQNRTTFSLLTPHICQQKYRDIKRRFSDDRNAVVEDQNAAVRWLDELRRLRVAELRRDLQRYDLSIVSLQLKVKRLKEEKEKEEIKEDLNKTEENEPADVKGPVEPEGNKPDRISEPDRVSEPADEEDDSCNGSSNSKEERREGRRERVDSAELVESVAESKDESGGERGVKESSDVQSTASLWRSENNNDNSNDKDNNNNNIIKRRREKKIGLFSGSSSGDENQSPAFKSSNESKSQPLVEFLEIVRARKLGLFFERLECQETPKYTSLIKQHIDLGAIQRRLEEGQYADCHTKFYRDLMLLINNTIIFFPKNSPEYKAALELRQLLNKQYQPRLSSKPAQPAPLPKPTKPEPKQVDQSDLKPKLTINGPVIACRKRSSIAGKSSRGVSDRKERAVVALEDEKPAITLGEMVKKRTRDQSFGSRSSSSKNNNSNPSPSNTVSGKGENSGAKADKKKPTLGNLSNKMKQGSGSGKSLLLESLKSSDKRKTSNDGNVKSERRKDEGLQNVLGSSKLGKEKAKAKEEKESLENRSNRRPPKRAAAIAAMGKRGRDGGGEGDSQSKKRQRK